jgi:hypothetical protein
VEERKEVKPVNGVLPMLVLVRSWALPLVGATDYFLSFEGVRNF